MRTPDDIFEEFASRREGIITALTHEQQAFWKAADPDAQNLSLYVRDPHASPGPVLSQCCLLCVLHTLVMRMVQTRKARAQFMGNPCAK